MRERIFQRITVFGVIALAVCFGSELNSDETEARIFLNQTSEKLFSFFDEIANKAFDDIDNSYDQYEAFRNYSIIYKEVFEDSRKFDFENFKDEELKYAFKILGKEGHEMILGEKRYLELYDSLKELENLSTGSNIEKFQNNGTKLAYSTDIEKIFERSNQTEELLYYWSAYFKLTGEWAEENLNLTLEAIKDAAHLNGLSPLEFWLRGFNITDMEDLMAEFQPFYMELHAFIRNLLRKKYGESIIAADGLIPDHLLEHVLYQAWSHKSNESIIEEMFPYESLPPVETTMMERFKAKELYEIAEGFYETLGFEKYPPSIWGDRIKMAASVDDDQDAECSPRVWSGTPNIHLEFCEKMRFLNFLEAYEDMEQIYHTKEMVGLPEYYFRSPNSLDSAIRRAITLSASTHHNLKAIGMILDDFDITPEVEMNRLLRMTLRNLLYIPINLVNAKTMADLVSGNVGMADLNSHYWHLKEKYAGVGPPKDHESHTLDLPYYFFEEMNENQMSIDFTEQILGYQIHKKLCELSGKYPKEPLHLCDITGSKKAGDGLKKMMQLGTSKPFKEVLATMFPENPTVRIEALLEYYNPIKNLVVKKNKEANVKPGWKTVIP